MAHKLLRDNAFVPFQFIGHLNIKRMQRLTRLRTSEPNTPQKPLVKQAAQKSAIAILSIRFHNDYLSSSPGIYLGPAGKKGRVSEYWDNEKGRGHSHTTRAKGSFAINRSVLL
jgi:hypothetical protein